MPAFAGDVAAGEQVFNANCAACHAGGQNVIMPDKTLEKDALEQYLAGGRNEAAVMTQVTNGKNAMPAFGGRLSDEDIADVATYVIKTSEAGWDE
jgi:cytochrome c6